MKDKAKSIDKKHSNGMMIIRIIRMIISNQRRKYDVG